MTATSENEDAEYRCLKARVIEATDPTCYVELFRNDDVIQMPGAVSYRKPLRSATPRRFDSAPKDPFTTRDDTVSLQGKSS